MQCVALPALLKPVFVGPLELFRIPDDGRILGRGLEEKSVRIGLQADLPVQTFNLKLVVRAFADAGNKNFPYAGSSERTQRMTTAVPVVEIAHDTDALGIGRPNGKTGPVHPVDGAQLRAEFF